MPDGRASTAGGDTTCGNWTKSSNDGSALMGHHDRHGLTETAEARSWNSAHGSKGCSQQALVVSVEAPGYRSAQLPVVPDRDRTISVALVPLPAPEPARPPERAAPTHKAAPTSSGVIRRYPF